MGAGGLLLGRDLPVGTGLSMGAGYVPRAISALLILVGAVVACRSLSRAPALIGRVRLRPLIVVLIAMASFGLAIERLGLPAAVVATVLIGGLADRRSRPRELVLLAAALAVFAVLVFVVALDLPIPVRPR
ncbi:MAG: tripartite tricarboxylate transporter TctB family protein [Candidatus Rokubacteria bacterium]|nr:tripartite tricarboxylate transporter TctB family protein [Candidatus Rokubacteria bacterium]